MKIVIGVLIVCLLLAGTVSAGKYYVVTPDGATHIVYDDWLSPEPLGYYDAHDEYYGQHYYSRPYYDDRAIVDPWYGNVAYPFLGQDRPNWPPQWPSRFIRQGVRNVNGIAIIGHYQPILYPAGTGPGIGMR